MFKSPRSLENGLSMVVAIPSHESIDSYEDVRKAFPRYYLQQKKNIKEPVEMPNIKQRRWESMEEFQCEVQARMQGCEGSSEMHENLWIYAKKYQSRADQTTVRKILIHRGN
ncbi:hypothetical protein Tco_0798003 [Tanacetum coccineum]